MSSVVFSHTLSNNQRKAIWSFLMLSGTKLDDFVAKSEEIKMTKAYFRAVFLKAKTDISHSQDCFKTGKSTLKLMTNMLRDKVQETIDSISLPNYIAWF